MLDGILRLLALHVVVAAERAQEEQFNLPSKEKTRRMEQGRYVYCADVWDAKESLGLPITRIQKWEPTPLEAFDF